MQCNLGEVLEHNRCWIFCFCYGAFYYLPLKTVSFCCWSISLLHLATQCQKQLVIMYFLWWQSKFEFQLRLQEFIEMVRAENMMRAITYARKYLAPWGSTHMKELQRVMATLAFRSNTECATYKVCTFFSWTSMIEGLDILIHAEDIMHFKQILQQYFYIKEKRLLPHCRLSCLLDFNWNWIMASC